jgi:hypothetical protein
MEVAMRDETALKLTRVISNILSVSMDNRLKIAAFEKVLEAKDATLYSEYQTQIEKLRNPQSFDMNAQMLEGLRTALAQDQD